MAAHSPASIPLLSLDAVAFDARVSVLYDDTPALVYGPISERIHGFDERVELNSLLRVTKSVALFMADWCGTEPH